MSDAYMILLSSAAALGVMHTAIGVDHSLPFVVLAKTRSWSLSRTLSITAVCGVLHVMSSVLVAALGLFLGVAGSQLSAVEQTRGSWAAWVLVGFGLTYSVVALIKTRLRAAERADRVFSHRHGKHGAYLVDSVDSEAMPACRLMPTLFIVFALGPCEALLPLLTASGITLSLAESGFVALVFSLATVATMLLLVLVGYLGVSSVPQFERWAARLQPHSHVLAGVALSASGLVIQIFGV